MFFKLTLSFILTFGVFMLDFDREILSSKESITIDKNMVKYKGLLEDVTKIRKTCESNVYNIFHKRRSFLFNRDTYILVECINPPKDIQEIKD